MGRSKKQKRKESKQPQQQQKRQPTKLQSSAQTDEVPPPKTGEAATTAAAPVSPEEETNLFWPSSSRGTAGNKEVNGEVDSDDVDESESDSDDDDDGDAFSEVLDSIVKIHCTHSEPDYLIPWQKQHQSTSTSSGFIISLLPPSKNRSKSKKNNKGNDDNASDGNHHLLRIMTNAHSVEYGTIVQVQKRGQEHKYEAIVEHIANECDLAILKIINQDDEPDFFQNNSGETDCYNTSNNNNTDNENDNESITTTTNSVKPLTLSTSLPDLQEEVDVLGYPTGGDSLSVTTGVVSRIEMQEYTQANTNLLAMQVDAAINPGNSGGPVVNDELEVIGVAFQGLDEAQNIGYVVPVTVVQHLLHDIQRHGTYTGFCSMGASFVWLQNKAFRKSLGMVPATAADKTASGTSTSGTKTKDLPKKPLSGVMIKQIAPLSPSKGILQPNDVVLQVDGIPVANDGKVPFRPGERVSLSCYIQTKFKGDKVKLQVLRKGQILDQLLECPVEVMKRLVPPHFDDLPPPYLIVAGLVFTVLSIPYLEASDAWDEYQSDQLSYLLGKCPQALDRPSDQFVILSQVLAHRENLGYDKMGDLQLQSVNGRKIRSLAHLKSIIDDKSKDEEEPFLKFQFQPDNAIIVMERSKIHQATLEVCKEQSIQNSHFIPPPSSTTSPGDGNNNKKNANNKNGGRSGNQKGGGGGEGQKR